MINKSYSSLTDREAISGSSTIFKGEGLIPSILGAFSFLIGVAALPLRLILRDNIGERSIRPISFLLAIAIHIYYFSVFDVMIGFVSIIGVGEDFLGDSAYRLFLFFALFVIVNPYSLFLLWSTRRAIKHFREKIRESQANEVGYTYHRGDSRYFSKWDKPFIYGFKTNQANIRMLVEPRAVIVIGLAISLVAGVLLAILLLVLDTESVFLVATVATFLATGLVIVLDAFCLAIDEISLRLGKRDKVLDLLDSEEDAKMVVSQKDEMKRLRDNMNRKDDEISGDDDFVQD